MNRHYTRKHENTCKIKPLGCTHLHKLANYYNTSFPYCCCELLSFSDTHASVYPLTPSDLAPGWLDGSWGKSREPMPGTEPSAWASAEYCEYLTIIFRYCFQGARSHTGRDKRNKRGKRERGKTNRMVKREGAKRKKDIDERTEWEGWTATAIGSRVLVFTLVLARSYTHALTDTHKHTPTHAQTHAHTVWAPDGRVIKQAQHLEPSCFE